MAPIRRLADVIIDTTSSTCMSCGSSLLTAFQNPAHATAADLRGELRISLRNSFGRRPCFRCALSAQSAFCSALAPFSGKESEGGALHSLVSADGSVSAPHRKFAGVFDSSLHRRGEELFDRRPGMYGRPAPVGDARGSDASELEERGYATKVVHRDLEKSGT